MEYDALRPMHRGGTKSTVPGKGPLAEPGAAGGDRGAAYRWPAMAQAEYRIAYTVRRSDRARNARIVVDADGVEVVIRRRMALKHVEPFLQEKRTWNERT